MLCKSSIKWFHLPKILLLTEIGHKIPSSQAAVTFLYRKEERNKIIVDSTLEDTNIEIYGAVSLFSAPNAFTSI